MPQAPSTFRPAAYAEAETARSKRRDDSRRAFQPWRSWYKKARWQSLRMSQLRREPLCETCLIAEDRVVPAEVVHHREPHRGIWERFIDPENLASVCKACHDGEIQRGERAGWTQKAWLVEGLRIQPRVVLPLDLAPSAIPLTIVCGAPGSGKSTWVAAKWAPGDTVIDLDAIMSELAGSEIRTQERVQAHLETAFLIRNKRLAALGKCQEHLKAWFIVGAPGAGVRQRWADQLKPHAVVVMETPFDECIRRIRSQPERAPTAAGMIEAAREWRRRYQRAGCDTLYVS